MKNTNGLESHLSQHLLKTGCQDLLGAEKEGFPEGLSFYRQNIPVQVNGIISSFTGLLIVTYADNMNEADGLNQLCIYSKGIWDSVFLRCIETRLGSFFLEQYGESLLSSMLEYLRAHPSITLREGVYIELIDDEILISKYREYSRESPHSQNFPMGKKGSFESRATVYIPE